MNSFPAATLHKTTTDPHPTPDGELVNRIVYLGSLVSVRTAVDSLLDTLRQITARWQPDSPLSNRDRRALEQLENDLKTYLIERDPLRSFTPETLQERLTIQSTGTHRRPNAFFAIIALSLLSAALPFLLPVSSALRPVLSIPLFLLTLHAGIAWLYLSALRNFKPGLRQAFIYICIGIVLFGLLYSFYATINYLGIGGHPLFKFGGLPWIIGPGFAFVYLGLRRYLQLLGLKSRAASMPLAGSLMAIVALILVLAPHSPKIPASEVFYFDLSVIGLGMLFVATTLGAVLARQISRYTNTAQTKPLRLLYWYLALVAATAPPGILYIFWAGSLQSQSLDTAALGGSLPEFLLLYIGYSFKKRTGQ
jgi:hypothetical protein